MTVHLGMDLGGTMVKWAVLVVHDTATDGEVVTTGEMPTQTDLGPVGVVRQLVGIAVQIAERVGGVESIGVGIPGLYDAATGRARLLPNLPGDWTGIPIADPVKHALDVRVRLLNDARAFTLAESIMGAGRGADVTLGVTIGTGVGGGIACRSHVYEGHDGTAGEIGHQTILFDGPLCGCGNHGCLEALASGRALAMACDQPTVEKAAAAARAGDVRANQGFARCGRYLGVGIANALVLVNPDVVVIGGGVAAAGDLLLGPIREELRRRVRVTDLGRVSLVTAELGIWSGAIGASLYSAERMEVDPGP
jgi:glucokinase